MLCELPEEELSVEQQNETIHMNIPIIKIKVNMSEAESEYMFKSIFPHHIYKISYLRINDILLSCRFHFYGMIQYLFNG